MTHPKPGNKLMGWFFGFVAVLGLYAQGVVAAQVDILNKELTVVPGQNATFMCRVAVPLQYCRVEIPGMKALNLHSGTAADAVTYYGNGLAAGECGFTINRVEDKNNGQIKCSLGIISEPQESIGTMTLTVARAPKPPELDLSPSDMQHDYKINDILHAACIVRDGRPVANISWYLGDDPVDNSELSMPTVIDLRDRENLQSKIQNLTHTLRASDNGKYLKCVAYHGAYPNGFMETKRQLDIKFPPLPQPEPIEEFGFEVGKLGVINVTIEANPKPNIEWTVNGQKIREGSVDNSGSIEAEVAREMGAGKYLANLRIARITKQDTEKVYVLTAYNNMGSQDYHVKISTAPEPKGWELGTAPIIGIVVAILLVILVASILIFAKVTGRWCFGGASESRHLAESSDTESADVRPKEEKRRNLPPIKLTAFFKKNKDKDEPAQGDVEEGGGDRDVESPTPPLAEPESLRSESAKRDDKEGLVYAELDLVSPYSNTKPVVKNDDEKTEYAEILYAPKVENQNETDTDDGGKKRKDAKKK